MKELRIEYVSIAELHAYKNNAKVHTKQQVDQIAESIKQFGMNDPIAVWKGNEIIEGHGRLMACEKLGIEEVPIIRLDDLTDEQRRAYMNVHNQLTMNTGFDVDKLAEELASIQNIDMSVFGFEQSEDGNEDTELREDDYIPTEKKSQRIKPGEVWALGNHRLMCGDSTKIEDVNKLVDGEVDLCVTDPPYNVAVSNEQGMTIVNDNLPKNEFEEFLSSAFENIDRHLKKGGAFYIWHASSTVGSFLKALEKTDLVHKQTLIWVKNHFTLGRQDYQWQHEPCLYGWKEGAGHFFTNSRAESTLIDDEVDLEALTKAEALEILGDILNKSPKTVLREKRPTIDALHPTMKPITLIGYLISNSSSKGEKVLDLFGGSGSTMIACEQLERVCYTMEYDPKYAEVILDRWEKFTGEKAVLLDKKESETLL